MRYFTLNSLPILSFTKGSLNIVLRPERYPLLVRILVSINMTFLFCLKKPGRIAVGERKGKGKGKGKEGLAMFIYLHVTTGTAYFFSRIFIVNGQRPSFLILFSS